MAFGGRTDAGAAVTANVEKSVHASSGIASDNDALGGNLAQNEVARTRDFALAAGVDPQLRIETVHLLAENLRVSVVATRKSFWRGRHFSLHGLPESVVSSILCHKENVALESTSGLWIADGSGQVRSVVNRAKTRRAARRNCRAPAMAVREAQ